MDVKQYDGSEIIGAVAEEIRAMPEFNAPEWTQFVKTGVNKIRPPLKEDWWQDRVASVLRKVAVLGPVGVNKLRRKYGGKYRRGYKPSKFIKGSGKIVRVALQQLESAGMVKQMTVAGHKGRVLDTKGIKLLASAAKKVRAKPVENVETEAKAKPTTEEVA